MLDHIAKPLIRDGTMAPWAGHIKELAREKNVFCKLSGMVTEAKWHSWKKEDFKPFLDHVFATFGKDRLMFGSDWPVCLLSGSYQQVREPVNDYLAQFPPASREKVLGLNAAAFYGV